MEFEKYLINVCDAFRNPSRSKSTEKGNEIAERVATSTQFIGNNNGILTCTKRPGIHIDLTKVPDNCIEPTAIAFVSWVIGSRNEDYEKLEEFIARIETSWSRKWKIQWRQYKNIVHNSKSFSMP